MSYPLGVWVQNPSGYPTGSVMYSGPVYFPAGTDLNTQVGMVVFGPNGASASFPAIQAGAAGQSIVIDSATATALASTASPTVEFTQVSPGSSGVAAHYTVALGIPAGTPGASSAFALASATDLSGTAAVGQVPMVSSIGPTEFTLTTPHAASWQSAGPFSATASNVNTIKNLGSLAVSGKLFGWWIEVYAQALIIGAVDTQVNLVARLGGSTDAFPIISYALGQAGASPAPTLLIPQGLSSGTGIVAPSTGATIFLNAENQTASANPWSVATGATLGVKVCPTT